MRTVFRDYQKNECSVELDEPDHPAERRTTHYYWAPAAGGYVYRSVEGSASGPSQICERLERFGDTLVWDGQGRLVSKIRDEYYRAKSREKSLQRGRRSAI